MQKTNHESFIKFLKQNNQTEKYKSIIALNGDLPEKSFFCNFNLPIIGVDGGAGRLKNIGIEPDIITGDFDSIDKKDFSKSKIIYLPDQSSCDFHKTLEYASQNNLLPSIILGMNGGILDHIMQNINIFCNFEDIRNNIFYSHPVVGINLKLGLHEIHCNINAKISLIGMQKTIIRTHGLKWNLNDEELTFPGKNSAFNRSNNDSFNLEVSYGSCLLMIYLDEVMDCGLL
jgi:thiamine pyrophosphokinase